LIMSPWSRGGAVCSEVFDHTSLLRFLEVWTGVKEPNISAWRRSVCGDLTSAFDFTTCSVAFPALPDARPAADSAKKNCDTLPAAEAHAHAAPQQEASRKLSCPTPYQVHATLVLDPDRRQLELRVGNDGDRAASVHARQPHAAPLHLTVAAGGVHRMNLEPQQDAYDVELHGPRSFFRHWSGATSRPEPELKVTLDGANRTLSVVALNPRGEEVELHVTSQNAALKAQARAVKVPAQSSKSFILACAAGAYDYDITCAQSVGWRRQLAGHIETQPLPSYVALSR